jgi:hypothetical protein
MLSPDQRRLCLKTVSSTSLYYLALDALKTHTGFSIVRMADGEKHLYDLILNNTPHTHLLPSIKGAAGWLTEIWLKRMGLYDIPLWILKYRMDFAVKNATFFAPSPSGFVDPEYNVYGYWPEPKYYAEHFFNVVWNEDFKEKLVRAAGHVLCIHGNASTVDSMQLRVQSNLDSKVSWIQLTDWTHTVDVIEKAKTCTAPLVIFSGGPSGKMIGPSLSSCGKVVLDIGNQMDRWTFAHLPMDRNKANLFHQNWSKNNSRWIL